MPPADHSSPSGVGFDGRERVVFAASSGQRHGNCVAGFDENIPVSSRRCSVGYNAFGFAANIDNDIVVLHGNNGSLQSLTGRIVRGVFALLLFELGEYVAKRRFFLGTRVGPRRRQWLAWAAS